MLFFYPLLFLITRASSWLTQRKMRRVLLWIWSSRCSFSLDPIISCPSVGTGVKSHWSNTERGRYKVFSLSLRSQLPSAVYFVSLIAERFSGGLLLGHLRTASILFALLLRLLVLFQQSLRPSSLFFFFLRLPRVFLSSLIALSPFSFSSFLLPRLSIVSLLQSTAAGCHFIPWEKKWYCHPCGQQIVRLHFRVGS